jgi:DNA-binding MarR family transcriptional regulator
MAQRQPEVTLETTLHVKDHCLCLYTQRAARALARRFDRAFAALDLTNGQFSLLMALNRPDAPTISSVAALLGMDRTSLTAALKPLERRGLVMVQQNPNDKRSRVLRLTPAGRRLLVRAVPIWKAEHARLDAQLGAEDADRLRAMLSQISADEDALVAPA